MLLGIDILTRNGRHLLQNKNLGLVTNLAATDGRLRPTVQRLVGCFGRRLKVLFAPEHGLGGVLQDQVGAPDWMNASVPVVSLYGPRRSPSPAMFRGIDVLVVDLPDVGSRYYTYAGTAFLAIRNASRERVKVLVLDRPNPLNGTTIQGPVLERKYRSFVGMASVPVRHGFTIGELLRFLAHQESLREKPEVIRVTGWKRHQYYDETGIAWTIPSPNMPTLDTALVYPGMCLIEGTNLSEGRGTTRPFELCGAPWIDPFQLVGELDRVRVPGVRFRPVFFKPTFHKHAGRTCGGIHLVVTDRNRFDPVLTALQIIMTVRALHPRRFAWRRPPYEFERRRIPFDILIGNGWIRPGIEQGLGLRQLEMRWRAALRDFDQTRREHLLYR